MHSSCANTIRVRQLESYEGSDMHTLFRSAPQPRDVPRQDLEGRPVVRRRPHAVVIQRPCAEPPSWSATRLRGSRSTSNVLSSNVWRQGRVRINTYMSSQGRH